MSRAKPGMLLRHGAGLALVFLALLGWAARLGADNSAAASVGARWLNLEGDPRVTALGGAYAGLADGLPALGLNPGGLARLQGIQASLGDQIWDEDVSVQRLAYGQRLDQASALGLDLNYVNFGSIQTISIVGGYPVEGGTLNPYAGSLDLSYGRTLWGGLSAGVTAKLLTENLVGNSADALAADLGLLYAPVDRRWGLGASVLNLGGALDTAPLPLQGRLGGSYGLDFSGGRQLRLLGDLLLTAQDGDLATVLAGLEYQAGGGASFRAGYRVGQADSSAGPSAGIGLAFGWLGLDYSYSLLNGLSSQQMDLTLRFGAQGSPDQALPAAAATTATVMAEPVTLSAVAQPLSPAASAAEAGPDPLRQAVTADLHHLLNALDQGDSATAGALTEKLSAQYLPVRQAVAEELKTGSVQPALFSGEFADAKKSIQVMVQLDRNNPYNYEALGNVEWFLGDDAQALKDLQRAYLLDPSRSYLQKQIQQLGGTVPATAP